MDVSKVLFITQGIEPYLPKTEISNVGHDLPQGIQEKGFEVRTFMPKYGCINERRNQLHEVIRLSGMNLIIDDTDHPLIIKVATMLPSRMQVYFIYNEDYFQHSLIKELETDISPEDNDERSMFFVRGALETVKKLRWIPDVIHCHGWISALTPVYLKHIYNEDPVFRNAKVVYSLYDEPFGQPLDKRLAEKMEMDGVPGDVLKDIQGTSVGLEALTKLAIANSDGIIQHSKNVSSELISYVQEKNLPFLPYIGDDKDYIASYAEFYKSL